MRILHRPCGTRTYASRYVDSRIILRDIRELTYVPLAPPQCNSLSHLHRSPEYTCICVDTFSLVHIHGNTCIYALGANDPLRLDRYAIYILHAYIAPVALSQSQNRLL